MAKANGILSENTSVEVSKQTHRKHNPLFLTFDKLNVSTAEGKKILHDVSGEVRPGEVLAIMGPSGAGKSTLLNFLSGREKGMSLDSGEVLINGQKATKRLRRGIGYVLQEDVFFSHLTVNETLEFVGEVRLPDSLSKSEKRAIVGEVIEELSLTKCGDTVMGGGLFITGCSGGEKKRCSIAVELITNPSLLIMDEPTSGLDSSTACNLIQAVKKLAVEENRAVLTTIHQPSSHVFHMFDKILLLCNGNVAYYGKTSGVIKFFEYIDMPCYANWNPADFIMEQLTADEDTQKKIIKGFQDFRSNPEFKSFFDSDVSNGQLNGHVGNGHTLSTTDSTLSPEDHINGDIIGNKHASDESNQNDIKLTVFKDPSIDPYDNLEMPRWPTGYKTQAVALCRRSFIQAKSEFFEKPEFIKTLAISIICGLLWFNTPYDEDSLQDRKGLIFFVMIYLTMSPMFFAIMTFPTERNAIAKERAAGMYRLSAYYTAKCLSELPIILFQPLVLYTIMYWMSGLNRSPVFLMGFLNIITITLLAQTFGLCIGASIKNFKQSITFAIVFAMTCMLLGGFYTQRIPVWLDWAKYLSHISYAYNIFIIGEFKYAVKKFKCSAVSAYTICSSNTTQYIDGEDIYPQVSTIDLGIYESFAILWGYILFFRILFYLSLRYLNKPK